MGSSDGPSFQRIPPHPDVFLTHLFESPGALRQTQSMALEDYRGNFPSKRFCDLGIALAAIQPFQEGNFLSGPAWSYPIPAGFVCSGFLWHFHHSLHVD
jgi:hypothetical protein